MEFGGEWAKALSGAEFLLGSQNDIHVFATEDNLKILAEADELYMDGTFQITSHLFYQVFTVHAFKHGQPFPLAYCLLPGKSREAYNECFTMLKSACQDRNLNVLPRKITINFELGLLQAVELQFPTAKIQGCFYHYSQSIWRKVQNLGLQTMYRDNPTFKAFVSKMVALSFCPKSFVRVVWMGLKAEAPEVHRIEELVSYFEKTWLNGSYPIKIWNYHKVDGPRTNNPVEGWHDKINRVAGKPRSNIFEVVELFKGEQATTEVKLQQPASGGATSTRSLKERSIVKIIEKFDSGDYSLNEYINSLSKWMGFE